jgi:hypothetical protein
MICPVSKRDSSQLKWELAPKIRGQASHAVAAGTQRQEKSTSAMGTWFASWVP